MIKMIVTDLDDTLLHTDKSVSQYTKEVFIKVRRKGIKIVLATARGERLVKDLALYDLFDLFDAYILTNGANAFADGTNIYNKTICPAVMRPLLQKLTKLNIKAAAQINGTHYANFDVQKKWSYINNFVITDFSEMAGNADKLYAAIEKPEQVRLISSVLPRGVYLVVSKDNLAMIMHSDATKAKAVRAVAEKWNIDMSEVMAFGDDLNDIDMLIECGAGVAVENALNEVTEAADHICGTNDNDGVAKWLEEKVL